MDKTVNFMLSLHEKSMPAIQETSEMWVQSLGWEDPLGKKLQPTPVCPVWTEEPDGLQSMGL